MYVMVYEIIRQGKKHRMLSMDMKVDKVYWSRAAWGQDDPTVELHMYAKPMLIVDALRWVRGEREGAGESRRAPATDADGQAVQRGMRDADVPGWIRVAEEDKAMRFELDRAAVGYSQSTSPDLQRAICGGRQHVRDVEEVRIEDGSSNSELISPDTQRAACDGRQHVRDVEIVRIEDGSSNSESTSPDLQRAICGGRQHVRDVEEVRIEDELGIEEDEVEKLLHRLMGRRLLVEEVRRLSMDLGVIGGEGDSKLFTILQLLYLRGQIRLAEGMERELSLMKRLLMGRLMDRLRLMDFRVWLPRVPLLLRGRVRARLGMVSGESYVDRFIRKLCLMGNGKSVDRKRLKCGRCNSGTDNHHTTNCAVCGEECTYCEACLQMGRVRECSVFVVASVTSVGADCPPLHLHSSRLEDSLGSPKLDSERIELESFLDKWNLSDAQRAASREALAFAARPAEREGEQFLIWAVTGAGKTEMVYPLVEYMLQAGGRVLLTAPRRDVVLELAPRLEKAFADHEVIALYGGSEHRWDSGRITVATTHQLLRLERCFDLVVLDELDAYPYHNNPMLAYAARRACKPHGKTVLLTATPPREQQLAMRQRRLPHAMVPVRYHRHPLPEPRILRYRGIAAALGAGRLPSAVRAALAASLQRGAQVFVFVTRIEHVEPLTRLLRRACAGIVDAAAVDGTSSRDTDRANRVRRFRSCEIRMLVTTTILERGVTIPRSDVFVLDADADLFDEAALVQMAGRAGRSADDPCGRVYFVARARTDGQVRAVRHIRAMNTLARKRGLLLPGPAAREGAADA